VHACSDVGEALLLPLQYLSLRESAPHRGKAMTLPISIGGGLR